VQPVTHALVMTAGLGTRLRPLTDRRAKPAIPVAGEPMIRRILTWAAGHGIADAVMNLHHLPETVTAAVGDGKDLGLRARYSWEQPQILGSAGGPRLALPIVGADTFFIINGDTLTDMNLVEMAQAHRSSGARVTLAVVPNREFSKYGGVVVDDESRVTGFVPRGAGAEGSWHFIGVQVADASVFAPLPVHTAASSIGGVYDRLLRETPGSVRAHRGAWAFFDVGTPGDYLRTTLAFSASGVDAGRRTRVDPSARVTRTVLWDDIDVGPGASLDDCVVTDGVRVPSGAAYRRSILMMGDQGLIASSIEIGNG
jgi:mannose-1-phosphate guanylyltransferase